jgi:arabinofuranosyltransferase
MMASGGVASDGHRKQIALVFALCLVPYLAFVWHFDFVTDDAYINFRFARNLARGLGFVYNPGVDPPVEGTSEFLWVLLLTPVEWLGGDPAVWSRALSVASGVALLWMLASFLVGQLRMAFPTAFAACLWVATFPPFTAWSTGGLSTVPFALLLFWLYARMLGPRAPGAFRVSVWASGLLTLALLLLRAECLPWVLVVHGLAIVFGRARREPQRVAAAWKALAFALAGFAVFEVWRIHYFGYPLPNTAYAKVGGTAEQLERGLYYLARMATTFPTLALGLAAALVAIRRERTPWIVGAAALALVSGAFMVAVGGDFMGMFRFLAPAVPLIAVLFAAALDRLRASSARVRAAVGAAFALHLVASMLPAFGREPVRDVVSQTIGRGASQTQLEDLRWQRDDAREWTELGRYLKRYSPPGASLVARGIGAVGYASELTIFDRHGLVSLEVSHGGVERVRAAAGHDLMAGIRFFESRQPTFGYAGLHRREELEAPNPALLRRIFEKFGDAEMTELYRPVVVVLPESETSGRYMLLAERATPPPAVGEPARDLGWRGALLAPENRRLLR